MNVFESQCQWGPFYNLHNSDMPSGKLQGPDQKKINIDKAAYIKTKTQRSVAQDVFRLFKLLEAAVIKCIIVSNGPEHVATFIIKKTCQNQALPLTKAK